MNESKKDRILNRLMTIRRQSRRISMIANVLIVLYIILWIFEFCYVLMGGNLGDSTYALPYTLIVFITYVIKVLTVEYLNRRADVLENELDKYYVDNDEDE